MGRVLSKKCRHLANNCVSPLLLNSHVQQVRSCLLLKRRIGNGNTRLRIAESLACFRNYYRAENLCYQFEQGQKLLPQFRKIVCLVFSVLCTQADKLTLIQCVLINVMCLFKDGTRAARRREYERRA